MKDAHHIVILLLAALLGEVRGAVFDVYAEPGVHTLPGIAPKCVFILSTEMSRATALMDALNQLPHYLIRGEAASVFMSMFHAHHKLNSMKRVGYQELMDWQSHKHESFNSLKGLYDEHASKQKLIFFNEFDLERVMAASQAFYSILYGHFGPTMVTGFTEVRYTCGARFNSGRCKKDFRAFVGYASQLCEQVKILLVSRWDYASHAGQGPNSIANLRLTVQVYDEYAERFPEQAFRVYTEDMFDAQKNETLASRLLDFLGESPFYSIRFTRMPQTFYDA